MGNFQWMKKILFQRQSWQQDQDNRKRMEGGGLGIGFFNYGFIYAFYFRNEPALKKYNNKIVSDPHD